MSTPARENLRRMPGKWHGILLSRAGLFAESNALLVVEARGLEERYRRLYFRDIQAIVVNNTRRLGISRADASLALLALIGQLVWSIVAPKSAFLGWLFMLGLIGAWAYRAFGRSCRCRVYTALGPVELRSIRRRSDARHLIAAVVPEIEAVQGILPPGWESQLELPEELGPEQQTEPAGKVEPWWKVVAISLILTLFMTAAIDIKEFVTRVNVPLAVSGLVLIVEAASAVGLLVATRRRSSSLRSYSAVVLAWIAIAVFTSMYYVAVRGAMEQRQLSPVELLQDSIFLRFQQIDAAVSFLLGLAGTFLVIFRAK